MVRFCIFFLFKNILLGNVIEEFVISYYSYLSCFEVIMVFFCLFILGMFEDIFVVILNMIRDI